MFDGYPKSALEAKACSAKFYFTGKPCARGHITLRYAHGSCVECKTEDRSANAEKMAAYLAVWRKQNSEKIKEYQRQKTVSGYDKAYYKAHRERMILKAKEWAKRNPEKAKENLRNSRLRHLEDRRQKDREHYAQNREARLAADREYRERNRNVIRERTKRWRKENPDKAAATNRNKRLKRRGAVGTITSEAIARMFKDQRGKCAWCKVSIKGGYHLDHIIPLAKGGTNLPSNAQLLCQPCNQRKHASDPIDFARREGRLL